MKTSILVVDDEPDIPLLFEQSFKEDILKKKITFFYAKSGEEALQMLQDKSINVKLMLILSDINMPGIRGLDLLKIVKERTKITVFMVISYGDHENLLEAFNFGVDEILTKPLDFNYLKELIKNFVRLKKVNRRDNDKNLSG